MSDSLCAHEKSMPKFDEAAAAGMDTAEVRKKYPRFMGKCPECGEMVILYASFAHYVYGDW